MSRVSSTSKSGLSSRKGFPMPSITVVRERPCFSNSYCTISIWWWCRYTAEKTSTLLFNIDFSKFTNNAGNFRTSKQPCKRWEESSVSPIAPPSPVTRLLFCSWARSIGRKMYILCFPLQKSHPQILSHHLGLFLQGQAYHLNERTPNVRSACSLAQKTMEWSSPAHWVLMYLKISNSDRSNIQQHDKF